MFDHLAKGRFIIGISPGNLRTDAEAIGNLDEDRNKLFEEVIDVILEIWTRDPPYNIDLPNNRFKVSTAKTARLEIGLGGPGEALSEAVSGNRRHRGRAVLEGRDRDGQARLPSALGELPAAEMGQDPLGELRAGQDRGRQDRRHHRLARRAHDLRVRGRQDRPRATPATTPTARTCSTSSSCWRNSAPADGSRCSRTGWTSRTRRSPTIT